MTATTVRLRTYQTGFGECLLLTVGYSAPLPDGRTERHVLIDFGSKAGSRSRPRNGEKPVGRPPLSAVAHLIATHTGGRLDAVVVTHRHQDHVAGFGDDSAIDALRPLSPQLIVRSWTDADEATRRDGRLAVDDASLGFLDTLDALAAPSEQVAAQLHGDDRVLAGRAKALAQLGVKNTKALAMLDTWAPSDRTRWVRAGDVVRAPDVLPGVRIEVLGPPTLEQVPGLASYASRSDEYWLQLATQGEILPDALAPLTPDELAPERQIVAAPDGFGRASWLLGKLHDGGLRQVLDIVAGFEDVLNNTSVVLLVTVGKRSLLLGGDAQIENWSYALDRALGQNGRRTSAALRRRLADVDLYKVGHHGSRNATPRRLVELWRTARTPGRPFVSILSTLSGTYGSTAEGVVPKPALLDALRELGPLHSTEDLPDGVWWFDVEAPTDSPTAEFVYSKPDP